MRVLKLLTALLILALAATACGGSDGGDAVATSPDEGTTTEAGSGEAAADADIAVKPEITIGDGEPPAQLLIEDLVVGDGDEATLGSTVSVDYVGVGWTSKQEFDASWGRGPFTFSIGAQQVIAGWDQGVEGMKVGGRRQLTIPPSLAYGDAGAGGVIAPGETLVFVVDLRSVN